MRISTLFIFLLLFSKLNAQKDNTWELLNMPKVQINKDLVAYTISHSTMKNGVQSKVKTNNPSTKNPYFIFIRSDDTGGKIVVNNKKSTEDINLKFRYIYKIPESDNAKVYEFLMLDEKYTARYFVMQDGSNDILFLSYKRDSNNSVDMYYTISKI